MAGLVLYCVKMFILVLCVECVNVSNVVFGKEQRAEQCGRVSVYCVRVFIIELGVECVTVSNVVFKEGKDRQFIVSR